MPPSSESRGPDSSASSAFSVLFFLALLHFVSVAGAPVTPDQREKLLFDRLVRTSILRLPGNQRKSQTKPKKLRGGTKNGELKPGDRIKNARASAVPASL